jgi:hypothetical protein
MMPLQPLARHQRGAEHDEERPEIGDQAGLDRRRVAQRGEIEEVVAEQAGDADHPDLQRDRTGPARRFARAASREPDERADGEGEADSRNGGTLPDASVSSASSAHMATAEKPIKVARAIRCLPRGANGRLLPCLEPPRLRG